MYAEVIVDIAHSDVDKIFDYECGEGIEAGMRVAVPFGKGATTGFVMRVKGESEVPRERLRKILRAEDTPALTAESLLLAKKIAARYRVPLALTLRLFLPAEMRSGKVGERYRTVCRLAEGEPTLSARAKQQRALVEFLKDNKEADSALLREKFGGALKALLESGAVVAEKRRVFRDPYRGGESARRRYAAAKKPSPSFTGSRGAERRRSTSPSSQTYCGRERRRSFSSPKFPSPRRC